MTKQEEILAEIYIQNKLEGEALAAFEKAMKADEVLSGYVSYLILMKQGAKEYVEKKSTYDFIAELSEKDVITQQKKRKKTIFIIFGLIIISILGIAFFTKKGQNTENTNEQVQAQLEDTFSKIKEILIDSTSTKTIKKELTPINVKKDKIKEDKLPPINIKKDTNTVQPNQPLAIITRADKSDLAVFQDKTMGGNIPESELWLKYFFNQEYNNAFKNMPTYVQNVDLDSMAVRDYLIAGIIYLNITKPDYEVAKKHLDIIIEENLDDYITAAYWYLSIVNYHQKNPMEVRKHLDAVLKTKTKPYRTKAEKFEKDLMKIGFIKE